jgi:endonuclease III
VGAARLTRTSRPSCYDRPSAPPTPPSAPLVLARLREHYGDAPPRSPNDPLAELVETILSQHTSDANSARAFASLMATFGSWEAIRAAPLDRVADAIRSGGLAEVKAPRIVAALDAIYQDRGELSLDFLHDLDTDEARRYLTSLEGVGPKTAACVLLFACGKPALPVDTHVFRVSRRLGLIGPRTDAARAHRELEAQVPPEDVYDFHVLLIWHGRRICKAPIPRCSICPLVEVCPKVGVASA